MAGQRYTVRYQEWAGSTIRTYSKTFSDYSVFIVWLAFQKEFRPQYFVCIVD